MTYREYFEQHEQENLSWCAPYATKDGDYKIVLYENDITALIGPDGITERSSLYPSRTAPSFSAAVADFARMVNPEYDQYTMCTDQEIILDVMHEIGCAHCPLRDECAAMDETMGE